MTRIRKHWSSSRGTEDVESLPSHTVVSNGFHMGDTEGKPQSPHSLQLVDEDAMHMLAEVSLESLEQDSGIRNLKRENTSAQVMAAMSAKSLHRVSDMQNVKNENSSAKIWEPPFTPGSLLNKRSKSEQWYQKLSSLWNSEDGPAALPKVSTRREAVDEEQSKASSVADNEMGDSDLTARVERLKKGLAAAQLSREVSGATGLISGLLKVHCSEREPSNEENSRDLEELVFGQSTGRKRRKKPWESESNLPSAGADDCRTDQKSQKSVNGDVNIANDTSRRRLKVLKPQEQSTCDKQKIRAEPETKHIDNGDGNQACLKLEKVSINGVDRNQAKEKSEQVGNDLDDKNLPRGKSQKVENDIDDKNDPGEKSHEEGTEPSDRKRFRAKTPKAESGSARGSGDDIFPKGWKYKGLAQIAEKDEAANGQTKKLCGRTDGHNWRCPLRVVEGFSLCQHHLNKARAKKMGKSNQLKKQPEKKSDESVVSPHSSDSGTFEPSLPSDHHVPTKLRRRHKTAKLSVL